MNDKQVMLRLPKDVLERADALLAHLTKSKNSVFAGLGVKRASLLRLAIMRGLVVLEKELVT
jgi:predicted DNA-binding protein